MQTVPKRCRLKVRLLLPESVTVGAHAGGPKALQAKVWHLLPGSVTVCAHAGGLKALLAKVWLLLPESVTVCAHADGPKVLQAKSVAFAARVCNYLCTCRRSQSAAGSASTPLESLPLLQQQPTSLQHTDHQKLQEQAQQAKAQTHSKQHSKGKKDGARDGASPAENLVAHADEAAGMSSSAGTFTTSVSGYFNNFCVRSTMSVSLLQRLFTPPAPLQCIMQGFDLACATISWNCSVQTCTTSVLDIILSFSSDSMDLYAADVQIACMASRLPA